MVAAVKANNIAGKLRFIEKLLSGVVDYSIRKELMACSRAGRELTCRPRISFSTLYGVTTRRPFAACWRPIPNWLKPGGRGVRATVECARSALRPTTGTHG